jgi:hypothetical protein
MGQHGQRLNTGTCFSISSDDKLVLFLFPGILTKKCRILITVLTLRNRPSIVIKEGGGRIMAQLFILSYSDAVSFRDIR